MFRPGDDSENDGRACPKLVIARSPCDEAIQTDTADAFLDCFAALAMTGNGAYAFSTPASCGVNW
ncbi:hypothetical protein EAS61_10780 [Bradyrhizobium zhanjiangense]|uniref:Uncharacterized protein n=1 Tax=Bradyrhizobium zhanjiangense TaxID=1325107 RepID=A0A4Q0QSW5_9BRAD|nr:hypothetical protein EAS61_10780 [Bradyrhizobium zhanjiangense]